MSGPDAHRTSSTSDDDGGLPFLVAGVGASAGGLEAYTELLEGLSAAPGLSLLVVSHLDPDQKSHLPEILSRVSRMPVHEVKEGMAVEINHVYVIPPGTNMALTDGSLTLTARLPRGVPHLPIDHLFRSLAAIQKSRAIGIVLSGNGSDGAVALQSIKAAGGVTFAQDEMSAKHPSMPRAAVLEGGIDHVMRPRDIARELERIAQHPYTRSNDARPVAPSAQEIDPIAGIIDLLRSETDVDFTHYKQSTILRRIQRRMALRNLQDPADYLTALQNDSAEAQNLYQDFLIRVTQFFRDAEAFEALKPKVFVPLVTNRPAGAVLRIWVAGCSTGEEAYSLAIALLEFLDDQNLTFAIKILATDLNEAALEKARAGTYLDNIEVDVSPERLRRYFIRQDGRYQISKTVRELCVFSRHNMVVDPPFSKLDLVSCRNVLIYLDAVLHKRVLPLLHYALNPDGFLFLGTSENIGAATDLFEAVDSQHHIFNRKMSTNAAFALGPPGVLEGQRRAHGRDAGIVHWSALDVQREADRVLLNRYAPVGVVVDEGLTVLQFRGRTAAYLEPAPGLANLDLLRMLREGLHSEVRAAAMQARTDDAVVVRDGVRITDGNLNRLVRVEVIPFKVPPTGARFFLILFQEITPAAAQSLPPAPQAAPTPADQQVVQLQQEIATLRAYLQSVTEDQESTNEELKSANEEILSTNEELQSTNEELQTAKEEAQSANEELNTVNDELRHRNSELGRTNNDLVNLLQGVGLPIVMITRDLRVRRFTPLAEQVFNLIPTDIGRPISDIKPDLELDNLSQLIAGVIDTLTPHEKEVRTSKGQLYWLRIRPYVTLENKIDGASIVLVDIDAIKNSKEASRASK